jgi:hypothetical protein
VDFFISFCNQLIFQLGVVNPTPNLKSEGPPLVGCMLLLIHHIRRHPPHLEAVSSIRNLRTRHAVVRRDPSDMGIEIMEILFLVLPIFTIILLNICS